MTTITITPGQLALRLIIYFGIILVALIAVSTVFPQLRPYFPVGGTPDILMLPGEGDELMESDVDAPTDTDERVYERIDERLKAAIILANYLFSTVLLMLPVTWVYMAMKRGLGYNETFVRTLVVLPICITAVVLLIQESLPLAFGLAALVAAVRFRVNLKDTLDAIYVFCAISVGLSSGVGYVGVAAVMTLFFCFANLVLWHLNYGTNPIEERKREAKLAKHEESP